ncbi:MAG: hypothetical protein AAGG48_07860 [Planctomycetota bacterium]
MNETPNAIERYGLGLDACKRTGSDKDSPSYQAFGQAPDNSAGFDLMLEFRWKDGSRRAIGYSYLVGIEFDNSSQIKIEFVGHSVKLRGRRLNDLFRRLMSHRVSFVCELDPVYAAELSGEETVVTGIEIQNT